MPLHIRKSVNLRSACAWAPSDWNDWKGGAPASGPWSANAPAIAGAMNRARCTMPGYVPRWRNSPCAAGPAPRAVGLVERDAALTQIHVVHNWCYLGTVGTIELVEL